MIPLKLLTPTAKVPTRANKHAAAYDLYADITKSITIAPGKTVSIPTGIAVDLGGDICKRTFSGGAEEFYQGTGIPRCALVLPRSGLACISGIRPGNSPGLIDPDYRGEIKVCLHNDSEVSFVVFQHDRIAQLLILPMLTHDFHVVDELNNTERGEGGFGSTGK